MPRMNYHHLYYFWRVASAGNLTQVAKEIHLSQSALSAQLKQFQHNLDMELFEREGRKLVLTAEGRKVLEYAEDIFFPWGTTGTGGKKWLCTGTATCVDWCADKSVAKLYREFYFAIDAAG
ncbi:LysR family transcriptional regulator [Pseudobowmanella zhangzhouensis]|uniref:LysR family transcriptional regulator n=1 Tax=Pseudobowmanella zhangzhouensis TaxID=1537679 RepID=A0ABW1XNN5_9ALTE